MDETSKNDELVERLRELQDAHRLIMIGGSIPGWQNDDRTFNEIADALLPQAVRRSGNRRA